MDQLFQLAEQAIQEAVHHLKSASELNQILGYEYNDKELKIAADKALHSIIIDILNRSEIPILSEEADFDPTIKNELLWVVDPLDGSVNFSRGSKVFAISIALMKGDTPILCVLYDGLENRIISVDHNQKINYQFPSTKELGLQKSILSTGFPARLNMDNDKLASYILSMQSFQKVRMIGSAVQSLIHLADNKVDAYFEQDIMLWDVAGGLCLASALGYKIKCIPGSKTLSRHVLVTNEYIFAEACDILLKERSLVN